MLALLQQFDYWYNAAEMSPGSVSGPPGEHLEASLGGGGGVLVPELWATEFPKVPVGPIRIGWPDWYLRKI